jgi:hypothetical protein
MSTETNDWVLLPEEGKRRGFRNALAFRRWCSARGVKIAKDGRKQWVSRSSIDSVVVSLLPSPAPPVDVAVSNAVAAITGR